MITKQIYCYKNLSNRDRNYIHYEYVNMKTIPKKDYGDFFINILIDIVKEIRIYMPDIISSDIDKALRENEECLAFDMTSIYKYDANWYIMSAWYVEEDTSNSFITRENFIEIFQAWQQYQVDKPNFIIISRDNNRYSIEAAESAENISSIL